MSWAVGFVRFLVLAGIFVLPGWAVLSIKGRWRQWQVLQRWIVAISISIAFYPAFFYLLRFLLPSFSLGPYKMGALLVICAVWVAWQMRSDWRQLFAFDRLEWIAIAIFGMTLFSRFWVIRDYPFPAWSDSLHHALLTQLTAEGGQLPNSLEPYFPVSLDQYHLGLYGLSATVSWLLGLPAHTSLLWVAQILNGLCGLGVYLVLDRRGRRLGALVGAVVVGLLSHQPAFYVNWGRFTQIASQTVMLVAWLVTWETMIRFRRDEPKFSAGLWWQVAVAALLNSAVFLLHFRVAAFYLPLLVLVGLWELWQARQEGRIRRLVAVLGLVGIIALLLIMPVLWQAAAVYIGDHLGPAPADSAGLDRAEVSQTIQRYFEFSWDSVPLLVGRPWLLGLAALGALAGLLVRNKLVIASLAWTGILYLLGNAYLLGVPLLSVSNLGAVLIMWYLPIGLVLGSVVGELTGRLPLPRRDRLVQVGGGLVLVVGFVGSFFRGEEIEPFRYFVTSEDVAAMDWIRENTDEDALFAVNTVFWLPNAPHGTDGGYWIPYLTGRDTTAGVMLLSQGTEAYVSTVVALSQAVEQLSLDNSAVAQLRAMGVDYIYIGRKGNYTGRGLDAGQLSQSPDLIPRYQRAGVSILEIKP